MVKISVSDTKSKYFKTLFTHIAVQSLLDLKAVNGFINVELLDEMLNMSAESKTVFCDGKLAYTAFIMPTDENESCVYIVATTFGYSNYDIMNKSFAEIIKGLPKQTLYSIVYTGNHKYAKLLKDNNFETIKTITHGVEQRSFYLMELKHGKQDEE
jgi:hypothetical protein